MRTGTNITGGALGNGPSLVIPTTTSTWQPPPERKKSYRPPGWDRLPEVPPTPASAPVKAKPARPAAPARAGFETFQRPARTPREGRPPSRPDLNTDQLVAGYRAGATISALARQHGTTHATVRARLLAADVTIDTSRRGPGRAKARHQYARPIGPDRATAADLDRVQRLEQARADKARRDQERTERRARIGGAAPRTDYDRTDAIRRYTDGDSVPEVAAALGVSVSSVRRVIVASGVPLRDDRATRSGRTQHTRSTDEPFLDDVARLYTQGHTIDEVSRQLHTGANQVHRALVSRGISRRPAKARTSSDGAAPLKDLMHAYGITAADVRDWATRTGYQPAIPSRGIPPMFAVLAYALDTRSPA